MLPLPWANGQYTVGTDASDLQLRCVLLKEQADNVLKPTGYWSRMKCEAKN